MGVAPVRFIIVRLNATRVDQPVIFKASYINFVLGIVHHAQFPFVAIQNLVTCIARARQNGAVIGNSGAVRLDVVWLCSAQCQFRSNPRLKTQSRKLEHEQNIQSPKPHVVVFEDRSTPILAHLPPTRGLTRC